MPDNISHKLNLFQRAALSWDRTIPYNAAHVVKVPHRLDREKLEGVLRGCLGRYGLSGFRIERDGRRFRYAGGEARPSVEVLDGSSDAVEALRKRLEQELNARFSPDRPMMPVRFFALDQPGGFYLGLVYFHAVADASSIVYLVDDVVREYARGMPAEVDSKRLYPRASLGALSVARGLFGWLASLPRDISDVRSAVRVPPKSGLPKRVGLLLRRFPGLDASKLAEKSRSLGVTLNDVFLAGCLKAGAALCAAHPGSRRKKISVGSIISTRRDLGLNGSRPFGLYLSSFRVSCESPQSLPIVETARRVERQTSRVKRRRLYLRSMLETALALAYERFQTPEQRERFYAKHYPLAAGLTNLDLRPLWSGEQPDYWRAVSTNLAVPLVFSVTPSSIGLNVSASFSTHVYTREQAETALAIFAACLQEFAAS